MIRAFSLTFVMLISLRKKCHAGDVLWRPFCKILFNLFSFRPALQAAPRRRRLTVAERSGAPAEDRVQSGDLKTSGCSGCTGLKRWPAFHSRDFRTVQPRLWDSGLIYELEPSPEKCTGSRHRDWKSHPSQGLSRSLTTAHPPRDNCALLWYRARKWSWQRSIYQVIWARRMASTALAVFEFCPVEVPFTRSSRLCFSGFFPPLFPSQPAFMQSDKKYTTCTWNDEIRPGRIWKAKPFVICGVAYRMHRGSGALHWLYDWRAQPQVVGVRMERWNSHCTHCKQGFSWV